ncbi:hypothetical protein E2C01_065700 [Portunus trituberculatus]|uniref:Uncharacterized protein n=1 Tax=Portunus trituberculatus TaxID=210409 RepID=A0A5B7HSH8_PORTR|nr:hypothetical protein [Portunus trituberculatus]
MQPGEVGGVYADDWLLPRVFLNSGRTLARYSYIDINVPGLFVLHLCVISPLRSTQQGQHTRGMGTAVDSSAQCAELHGGTDGREGVTSSVGDISRLSADILCETNEASKMNECILE